jgi:hypothetical protein
VNALEQAGVVLTERKKGRLIRLSLMRGWWDQNDVH